MICNVEAGPSGDNLDYCFWSTVPYGSTTHALSCRHKYVDVIYYSCVRGTGVDIL